MLAASKSCWVLIQRHCNTFCLAFSLKWRILSVLIVLPTNEIFCGIVNRMSIHAGYSSHICNVAWLTSVSSVLQHCISWKSISALTCTNWFDTTYNKKNQLALGAEFECSVYSSTLVLFFQGGGHILSKSVVQCFVGSLLEASSSNIAVQVTVNGQPIFDAFDNLAVIICASFKGERPAACSNPQQSGNKPNLKQSSLWTQQLIKEVETNKSEPMRVQWFC